MIHTEQSGFRALADPTRREILHLLAQREMTIGEVAENFQMTRAAIKKHLSILSEGEFITVRTSGRSRINTLNEQGFRRVVDWFSYFDAFWNEHLHRLKTEIEKETQ